MNRTGYSVPPQVDARLRLRFCGDDTDQSAIVTAVVPHMTVDGGEDGPVTTDANAIAWMKLGSKLTNNDVPGGDELTVSALHTTILRSGIASVP
jgi:hypothetical protein